MSFSLPIALSICEEISVKLFSTNITGIVLAPKIGVGFSCALKKKKKKRKKEIFRVPSGGGVALVIHMQQWYRIFPVVSVKLRKVNNTLEGFSFFFFFFRNISTVMNRFIGLLTGNTGFFIQMVSAH